MGWYDFSGLGELTPVKLPLPELTLVKVPTTELKAPIPTVFKPPTTTTTSITTSLKVPLLTAPVKPLDPVLLMTDSKEPELVKAAVVVGISEVTKVVEVERIEAPKAIETVKPPEPPQEELRVDMVVCARGYVRDPATDVCVPKDSFVSTSSTPTCETGFTYDPILKKCVMPADSAPSNFEKVDTSCGVGYGWNPNILKCVALPTECAVGTKWDGKACVPQTGTCPAGTKWDGKACVPQTETCPVGTKWDGKVCVNTAQIQADKDAIAKQEAYLLAQKAANDKAVAEQAKKDAEAARLAAEVLLQQAAAAQQEADRIANAAAANQASAEQAAAAQAAANQAALDATIAQQNSNAANTDAVIADQTATQSAADASGGKKVWLWVLGALVVGAGAYYYTKKSKATKNPVFFGPYDKDVFVGLGSSPKTPYQVWQYAVKKHPRLTEGEVIASLEIMARDGSVIDLGNGKFVASWVGTRNPSRRRNSRGPNVVPSYGRDYKSKKALLEAWNAGKDFMIQDYSSPHDGRQINNEDAEREGFTTMQVRYNKLMGSATINRSASGAWK